MCENKHPQVAVVECPSYDEHDVEAAVRRATALLGGIQKLIFDGKNALSANSRIVLKPNLLSRSSPDRACTTHPAVFKAVGKLLRENGCSNLAYGDSPGVPMIRMEKVAEECGIKDVADSLSIPPGHFDSGIEVDFPQGRVANSFVLCDEVLNADAIINLCKMKTHQLERITGAVKNTFGCVYGVNKGASHAKFATAEVFAKMIADLNNLVRPRLHIMDGILAMEGNGPQSGTPKAMNVILASTDPVALDAVFCHLIDLNPELVPTNVCGREQGVGSWENVKIIGDDGEMSVAQVVARFGDKEFNVQRSAEYRGELRPIRFMRPLLEKKPVVRKDKCIGCGLCVKVCPVAGKAISLQKRQGVRFAAYDYSKCIKCYCCQEMCPEKAITVRKSLLSRIADRRWRL